MSNLIDESVKAQLAPIMSALISPVRLLYFTQKSGYACPTCTQQLDFLRELSLLSPMLKLEVYDFVLNGDEVMSYGIDKIPATVVVGEKDYGIRFFGLTAGYEFTSLLEAIMMVSGRESGLDPQLETLVKNIKQRVHLQVMVTLTCPYCPKMVQVAHQFAFVNENIQADMVGAPEFPHLTQRYNVTAVPKTIINGVHSFEGVLPADAVYVEILKAVSPEEYTLIREKVSQIKGERRPREIDVTHQYDVIIVGSGPAGMSAALYAVRKGLDVALISRKTGGQTNYTASIENYLGFPNISGTDITEAFRGHTGRYPIAQADNVNVIQVEKKSIGFQVLTEDKRTFSALSVIFCAGKEYRQLGVPGEDKYIGKGIGFCATCDAPLYRDKRVAVVGGGNSAFTAVRDLMSFASEIHLVHRRTEFKADISLVEEVRNAKNVFFHVPVEVKEFLGNGSLKALRLESVDGKEKIDLPVDGVFLEVGLTPNSAALAGLVELNRFGEIPVGKNQDTSVLGLFAAGDVTDVEEKQISVAVGQGASAALSAYKYLVKNQLVRPKTSLKEAWE